MKEIPWHCSLIHATGSLPYILAGAHRNFPFSSTWQMGRILKISAYWTWAIFGFHKRIVCPAWGNAKKHLAHLQYHFYLFFILSLLHFGYREQGDLLHWALKLGARLIKDGPMQDSLRDETFVGDGTHETIIKTPLGKKLSLPDQRQCRFLLVFWGCF